MSARGAAPRLAAARALNDVLGRGRTLGEALAEHASALPGGRDRALARRLCTGLLRDLPAMRWRLTRLLERPLPRKAAVGEMLLLSALSELDEGREPGPAVVHATVAAIRLAGLPHLSGLANAVLRNALRRAESLEAESPDDPEIRFGHPRWLIDRLRRDWPDDWQDICRAGNRPPPLWLRANRRRASRDALRDRLAGAGVECDVDERFPDAVRLEHGARVSELPGYEEGLFSVQDPAAQSCAGLLRAGDGMRVLDACAAPGGKAAHLLEMADVSLTALELDAERAARIGENFARLGLEGDVVVGDATRPRDWHDGKPFDRILVDAPCSATGIMRRHPDVRWLRRPDDIEANARVQAALLENLWPLLAPGGLLVYATCSILHAENRDRARAFLDAHPDAEIQPPKVPGAVDVGAGEQVLPGNLDRDGFYYLRLRRLQSG